MPEDFSPEYKNLYHRAERIRLALILVSKLSNSELLKNLSNEFLSLVIDCLLELKALDSKLRLVIIKINTVLDELFVESKIGENNLHTLKRALLDFWNAFSAREERSLKDIDFDESDFIATDPELLKKLELLDSSSYLNSREAKQAKEKQEYTNNFKINEKSSNLNKEAFFVANANLDLKPELSKDEFNFSNSSSSSEENALSNNNESYSASPKRKRAISLNEQKLLRNRRLQIISILESAAEPLSLTQISEKLQGEWSNKTIQRELNKMVSEGIINKIGQKRWTRYFLAES